MVTFPNAKINLGLYVTEKRPDGFHNIESCFYPVQWTDILEIIPAQGFAFSSTGIAIPGDPATNLCAKAYHLMQKDHSLPPVHIHLHKTIPIGAGLGGGSADGAFTIKVLNSLFNLGLQTPEMEAYARPLGSDCAFFIRNEPVYCFGKGDQFEDIQVDLSQYFIVLVNPQVHVGTAEAYAGIIPKQPEYAVKETLALPIQNWKYRLSNDFETTVCAKYPVIRDIKNTLYAQGALYASMSGSGSTVYGIFEKEKDVTGIFPPNFMIWQGKLG
ncbi:4-(cytidine 5'-diphospho)-2-C-methyl-D-erythritol kinase [Rhodocytophaga rosea]|uniref:4-diphosphocytidyl-2-C-methyl-D-erythritol kinase n=1 Tax=Rhodocytophaga rosea TaxID=2704465 RepID=A0A6C0GQE4_9BACT|nr:4-(cytidine 5'-diphospho)-2-C-methyl-D-erythritol kinase [Rhodocytophaga rosea]QHT70295.1 4-(cytidine 5'-diphospho)-2-C-methyl-D-erythritol kinase [Rhodocytophaga rosea]